jgi:hypothetical protein
VYIENSTSLFVALNHGLSRPPIIVGEVMLSISCCLLAVVRHRFNAGCTYGQCSRGGRPGTTRSSPVTNKELNGKKNVIKTTEIVNAVNCICHVGPFLEIDRRTFICCVFSVIVPQSCLVQI